MMFASAASSLKKALVVGSILTVTTMSVYSALMSSYLYMIPSHMGVCALREYHLGSETHQAFPAVVRFLVSYFYRHSYYAPPECQFPPGVPTNWINWMDTPAQSAVPFSLFCNFLGYVLRQYLVKLGWTIMFCGLVCAIPYLLFCAIRYAWKCLKDYVTVLEFLTIFLLLGYIGLEGPVYAQILFRALFLEPVFSGKLHVLACLSIPLAWILLLSGVMQRVILRGNFLPLGFGVAFFNTFGPRATLFTTVVSLLLWYFVATMPARLRRHALQVKLRNFYAHACIIMKQTTRLRRRLVFCAIKVLFQFMLFDESIGEIITQVCDAVDDGVLSPEGAIKHLKSAFRKLALKYHPDKNPNATADQFHKLMELQAAALQILEIPLLSASLMPAVAKFWLDEIAFNN